MRLSVSSFLSKCRTQTTQSPQTEFNNKAAATLIRAKTHSGTATVRVGTQRSYAHKPSRRGAAAATATVHSPVHRAVL